MNSARAACRPIGHFKSVLLGCVQSTLALAAFSVHAAQVDIPGPVGSGRFGEQLVVLPNGNIVVGDPSFSTEAAQEVGAAYLYTPSGVLISKLTGSSSNDHVGAQIVVLKNGNYLIGSPDWNSGSAATSSAVTWAHANTGISGVVTAENSLIGASTADGFGEYPGGQISVLSNGNYVVIATGWDNGSALDAGAVTWGNGSTGIAGPISASNSLVGTTTYDYVGAFGVTLLSNGNYVVRSGGWINGGISSAGAATWANGSTGITGPVSAANSLVGSSPGDLIGFHVIALSNGNYVVSNDEWDNGVIENVGAVTWANGSTGLSGVVSSSNSLIGQNVDDRVGDSSSGVVALSNGNYVVKSSSWDNGAIVDVGAVTWVDGTTGMVGVVSASNSLIGTQTGDQVGGAFGVYALRNGNYVVHSPVWDNGNAINVGAATWANGSTGLVGVVSPSNSLIGETMDDQRQGDSRVIALSNGNYVVSNPLWSQGAVANVGAVTWADGSVGRVGTISAANSLIGTHTGDLIGMRGVTALRNGNYVVSSLFWNNDSDVNVGAVTWASGDTGLVGPVSTANSLTGSAAINAVGYDPVIALSNGNYVIPTPDWSGGGVDRVGAVTWADGSTGLTGQVAATNSLVGTNILDRVGYPDALGDGNYVVRSPNWNAGMGAITLARGDIGVTGPILPSHSVLGTVAQQGISMTFAYDATRAQLVVGQPAANIVSLLKLPPDLPFTNGFE